MTKSPRIGLASFGVSYAVLLLLAAWQMPDQGWLTSLWSSYLLVDATVALCAVFIGLGVGRLTVTGTALCALLVQLLMLAAAIGLLVALSAHARGAIAWAPLLEGAARNSAAWLAGLFVGVAWPVAWLLLLRHLPQRPVPSASG